MMRLRPGYEVYWRGPGSTQIGVDPRCAVVLDKLSAAEQQLLEDLPQMMDVDWLHARGNELGMRPAQVRTLQRRLARAGVLVDLPGGAPAGPDDQYWRLARVAGVKRPRDRGRAVVELRRAGPLGLRTGMLLAQAGVGAVVVTDPGPVLATDVAEGPYRGDDLGEPRQQAALGPLRAVSPRLRTSVPPGTPPDVVLLVDHHVVDPVPVRRLQRTGRAHLSVLISELAVRVGPLVAASEGACTTCLEHYRGEEDERWPAVAAQAALRPPGAVETSLVWWGAVTAAQQLLAQVDGRTVAAESATLELTAWDGVPSRTTWSPHPDCECRARRRRARPPSRSSTAA